MNSVKVAFNEIKQKKEKLECSKRKINGINIYRMIIIIITRLVLFNMFAKMTILLSKSRSSFLHKFLLSTPIYVSRYTHQSKLNIGFDTISIRCKLKCNKVNNKCTVYGKEMISNDMGFFLKCTQENLSISIIQKEILAYGFPFHRTFYYIELILLSQLTSAALEIKIKLKI